ncbi:MAG TPA: bis(5'-nucleosyl)-tetraphosphatase (symmetrical) YqeK [Dehalococcoidia bacterium]|nr:bis(5'-nucleosyl)-tetraphosphatase (symmetrical) YqeK [Dehalococcoidia bacterium]
MARQFETLRAAVARLPRGLADHIEGVVAEARRLALLHRVDEDRAAAAAWGHDIARALSSSELLAEASRLGLAVDPAEEEAPILLHGPVGAAILSRDYAIDDPEVLAVARYHTTARAGMSTLEKVVFVADKIEVGKAQGQPALARVRQLADRDLDAAILEHLNQHLLEAGRRGWPLHPNTVAARNELLLAGRTRA